MNIAQPLPKQRIPLYFKGILHYCVLFCCSLMLMPIHPAAAKMKKTAVKRDQAQQKKGKKEKKGKSTKGEKRPCDIIAYTSLCLEHPRKLAKYTVFYHQGAHCMGLDINRIDITSDADIMHHIYCGKRLKSFVKDDEKSTWSLMQRYYTAQSLAEGDFNIYQNYKENQGKHAAYNDGILTALLKNAVMDAIQSARFKKQDAIFERMLPYMAGLYAIKKQVQLSRINVMMLATAAPVLCEPAIF